MPKNKSETSFLHIFSLENKAAIVTGAAGQLGFQIASALSEAGSGVVLADLDLKRCEERARILSKTGSRCICVKVDVTKQGSVRKMVEKTLKEFKKIDIMVNNAGIAVFTPFAKRNIKEFDKVLNVNVKGPFLCSQLVAQQMIKQKEGNIINIGSIYGIVSPDPGVYADSGRNSSEVYGVSKAGVIGLTRYLAAHLARYNIRVNCISPGGIFNNQSPRFVKNYSGKTPLGRMGFDTEIKGAVIFLASRASSYISGHNLVIDGGWTIW